MSIKKTGGKWDRTRWPCYIPAVTMIGWPQVCYDLLDQMLVPINQLDDQMLPKFEELVNQCPTMLDSGVFNLTQVHAERHKISMDQALQIAPEEIDNFEPLFDRYCRITKQFGKKLWGYVEIDQGGRENKIKIRARLEKQGIVPIPVYHPLNDGWDYFDYLAQQYDRICFGNVVQANAEVRQRLIATAWERRRKYPHLWIHALGLTASELTVAYPINSCDSSTWSGSVRWGRQRSFVSTSPFGDMGESFVYEYGSQDSYVKSIRVSAYEVRLNSRQMRIIAEDQRKALGADIGMFNVAAGKN